MRIENLLNPSPPSSSPPAPTPPPPPPPFTNGSMPMNLLVASLDPPTANGSAVLEKLGFQSAEEDEEDEEDEEKSNPKYEPSRPLAGDDSPQTWKPSSDLLSPPLPTHTPTGTRLRGTPTPPPSSPIFRPSSPLIIQSIETPASARQETNSNSPDTMMERSSGTGLENHTDPSTAATETVETGHRAEPGAP